MTSSGASARLTLDTSAYSHFRAGHAEVLERMAAAAVILVPAVVVGELEAGFAIGSRRKDNARVLAEFLAEPFVSVLDVDAEVGRIYGQLFAELRARGTPIPTNDIWIAACAMRAGSELLTFNRDFENVVGLPCAVLEP